MFQPRVGLLEVVRPLVHRNHVVDKPASAQVFDHLHSLIQPGFVSYLLSRGFMYSYA
jgi:hypothetical protein